MICLLERKNGLYIYSDDVSNEEDCVIAVECYSRRNRVTYGYSLRNEM